MNLCIHYFHSSLPNERMEEGNTPIEDAIENRQANATRRRHWVFTLNNPDGTISLYEDRVEVYRTCDEEGPHRDCYKVVLDMNRDESEWNYQSD